MTPPSPPRRLIGVSTKMYFSFARTTEYIKTLHQLLSSLPSETISAIKDTTDVFVIPDHVSLVSVIQQLRTSSPSSLKVLVGAQDAYHEDAGAYTGEVSPAVLAEVGCSLLELNHAERRRLFGETDESTALKVAAASRNGLVPLICVGERNKPPVVSTTTLDTTTSGEGEEILDVKAALPEIHSQISTALSSLPADSPVILAYEPVWAIGAPAPASPSYVVSVAREIRKLDCLRGRGGSSGNSNNVRILYGGSAGPGLFEHLKTDLDGLFLGRFAHDPEMFVKTIVEVGTA